MSEYHAYIVPVDDRPCRGKGPALVAHLQSIGLLGDFEDEELGWYAGGKGDAFPNVFFEYAEVYDSEAAHFIPSATTGGYGARCPACAAALDDTLHRLREKWPEPQEQKDMAGIAVRCPGCRGKTPLAALLFGIDTAMTRFYLMLANTEPAGWDAGFLPAVERVLGCRTRVVLERM